MPNLKKAKVSTKLTKHIHKHKDGSVWAKGGLLGGKMHGYWVWFRKPARPGGRDGSKMRSGYFEKGKPTGKWTTYDKNGRVVKVTIMK